MAEPQLIIGVILAAGLSRRLGRPKQMVEVGGKSLVRHVAERALATNLDAVLVVTGHAEADVASALDGLDLQLVHNPDFASGQGSSLIVGIKAASGADAILVLLSDQPLVSIEDINAVIAKRRASAAPVVMTGYGETRSHPILLGRELFPELLQLTGDQGARDVIRRHATEVAVAPSKQGTPPIDVDTEEAITALEAQYGVGWKIL